MTQTTGEQMNGQGSDYMIYDANTGDLLAGPMGYEHARYNVERSQGDALHGTRAPERPLAMARKGEMRRIQAGFTRGMSGNPPRDLRGRGGEDFTY